MIHPSEQSFFSPNSSSTSHNVVLSSPLFSPPDSSDCDLVDHSCSSPAHTNLELADSGGPSYSVVPGSHSTNSVHKKLKHPCPASRGRGSTCGGIRGKKRRAQSSQYTPYLKQTVTSSKGRKKKRRGKMEMGGNSWWCPSISRNLLVLVSL